MTRLLMWEVGQMMPDIVVASRHVKASATKLGARLQAKVFHHQNGDADRLVWAMSLR